MILFPLHHKSQLPDLTSHTNSLQPAFNNHKRTFQSVLNATDFKNQPTSFSLLSHSRFTSPPTLFSLFLPPTQTALSLKDPRVTDIALECWELRYKDAACSPNSRRREGVERRGKAPWVFLTWQGLEKLFRQSLSAGRWQSANTAVAPWATGRLNTAFPVNNWPVTYSELSAGI